MTTFLALWQTRVTDKPTFRAFHFSSASLQATLASPFGILAKSFDETKRID
jgi:hypothetical protein